MADATLLGLPDEILLHLLSWIDYETLCLSVSATCWRLCALSRDATLHRRLAVSPRWNSQKLLILLSSDICQSVLKELIFDKRTFWASTLSQLSMKSIALTNVQTITIESLLGDHDIEMIFAVLPSLSEIKLRGGHCGEFPLEKIVAFLKYNPSVKFFGTASTSINRNIYRDLDSFERLLENPKTIDNLSLEMESSFHAWLQLATLPLGAFSPKRLHKILCAGEPLFHASCARLITSVFLNCSKESSLLHVRAGFPSARHIEFYLSEYEFLGEEALHTHQTLNAQNVLKSFYLMIDYRRASLHSDILIRFLKTDCSHLTKLKFKNLKLHEATIESLPRSLRILKLMNCEFVPTNSAAPQNKLNLSKLEIIRAKGAKGAVEFLLQALARDISHLILDFCDLRPVVAMTTFLTGFLPSLVSLHSLTLSLPELNSGNLLPLIPKFVQRLTLMSAFDAPCSSLGGVAASFGHLTQLADLTVHSTLKVTSNHIGGLLECHRSLSRIRIEGFVELDSEVSTSLTQQLTGKCLVFDLRAFYPRYV